MPLYPNYANAFAPLPGAVAPTRYVGGTTSGAPVSGTFAVGDFVVAQNGTIWICTVAGSPGTWVAAQSGAYGALYLTQNAQTGTTYTLALSDDGKLVEYSNAGGITVTVPTNASVAYPVGAQVHGVQTGAGQVTVVGDSGVTVNGTPGLKARAQWSAFTLIKRATNTWLLIGDLAA